MKAVSGIFVFLIFLLVIFLNLGEWVDATEVPIKSDIVICLGGGTIDRVKKSIELLQKGYVKKNTFLLIGESWYNQPYLNKNYPNLAVVIDESPKNTKEEVLFIKKYMKAHRYKSALIVTDPPHSKRVKLLTSLLKVAGDGRMTFRIIGSDVKWWNAEQYYKNEHARNFVWHEVPKIIYTRFDPATLIQTKSTKYSWLK